jgi:hypothetical protein
MRQCCDSYLAKHEILEVDSYKQLPYIENTGLQLDLQICSHNLTVDYYDKVFRGKKLPFIVVF